MSQLEEIRERMLKIKKLENDLKETKDLEEKNIVYNMLSSLLLDQMDLMW